MHFNLIEKNKRIIIGILFLFSVFLILFRFADVPKVWVDEGVFTEVARNVSMHGVLGLQTAPGNFFPMNNFFLSTSYPVIFPASLTLKLFGSGVAQARLIMVLYMFILVLLFYLFSKERYGFYSAVLSVLSLVSFAPFYGDGRPVQGEVPGITFLVLGGFLLLLLEKQNFQNKKLAFFSGLAFGLSASVKPIYFVLVPASLFIVSLFWFRKIQNRKIFLILISGLILPMLIWLRIHFPTIDSFKQIFSMFSYFAGNHEVAQPILKTVLHNFFRFFTESTPVLFTGILGVTFVSFFLRFKNKIQEKFSIAECVFLLFIILNWTGYLMGTGWYRYFFPAHVLTYILFPGALFYISTKVQKTLYKNILLSIPVALIIFQFFFLFFLSGPSFSLKQERNSQLRLALGQIKPSETVLFYNAPEAVVFLKGDNYFQYLSMAGFLEVGDKNLIINPKEDYVLMSVPEDNANFSLKCYDKTSMSSYFFFKKIPNCKK